MKKIIKWVLQVVNTTLAKQKCKKIGNGTKVNFKCKFTNKTEIGNHCNFNGVEVLGGGKVTIGNYFHSGKECKIITSNHNYDKGDSIPYDNTYVNKDVTVEDFVWIGTRVIILGGVTLGEGCIIQAGSVVVNNIPPHAIAGGNPAKVFKFRDVEHFKNLKKQGKYH